MAAVEEIILSAPQEEFITSTCERNLFLAGTGSGKTHIAFLLSADFIKQAPNVIGFIGANTHKQLAKSTLKRIFDGWAKAFKWKQGRDFVVNIIPPKSWIIYGEKLESYEGTISFANGALIFTSSLENYSAIDGSEFGWAILDETKDTREEAVKEVIVNRLRQVGMWINDDGERFNDASKAKGQNVRGWNPLYILSSPAKVEWINEWFDIAEQNTVEEIHKHIFSETDYYWREKDGKCVVISSTFHNQPNLPKNYISNLMADYGNNINRINMLIYGSPVAKTGGEYVSGFDRMKTVKECEYIPGLPIHVSFDFNVIFVTVLCFQVLKTETGYQDRYFDEICLEAPRNNTEAACKEFVGKYFEGKPNYGLFYTGDASGNNRSVQSTEHCYQTIQRIFRPYISSNSDRTLTRNPFLVQSRDFINKGLSGGFPQIEIVISPKCKKLINDFEFLKEGADGGYVKQKVKDKQTGKEYEKNGHCFDAYKYSQVATHRQLYEQ